MVCRVCGCSEFNNRSGLFFCQECGTQYEDLHKGEEDKDYAPDVSTSAKIRSGKSSRKKDELSSAAYSEAFLTCKALNAILCCQVQSLINLGVSPKLKSIVFQLWVAYLRACKVCFCDSISKESMLVCDVNPEEVLHTTDEAGNTEGNLCEEDASVFPCSAANGKSDVPVASVNGTVEDVENKAELNTTRVSTSVAQLHKEFLTVPKIFSLCYLGLIISEDHLLLTDMIRLVRENQIHYLDVSHCLSVDAEVNLSKKFRSRSKVPPKIRDVIQSVSKIAVLILLPKVRHRPLLPIVAHFVKALNLPNDLVCYVRYLLSKCEIPEYWVPRKRNTLPFEPYEIQAMAYIILSLKLLFVLDGKSEIKHSKIIKKLNSSVPGLNFFIWSDWMETMKLQLQLSKIRPSETSDVLDVNHLASRFLSQTRKCQNKPQSEQFSTSLCAAFSKYVPVEPSSLIFRETSFPLTNNQQQSFFNNTIANNWTCKDFSNDTVLYRGNQYKKIFTDATQRTLYRKLLKQFYGSSSRNETPIGHWYLKPRVSHSLTDIYDSFPNSFKMLLNLATFLGECNTYDLYMEMIRIEKRVFMK